MVASSLRIALILSFALGACRTPEPDDSERRNARAARAEQEAEPPVEPGQAAAEEPPPPTQPAQPAEPAAAPVNPQLLSPGEEEQAPATYAVQLETSEGPIVIDVTRAWAPKGADRFYNLVKLGYFTDVAFFRVLEGFMAQAGIHGDPRVNRIWTNRTIQDDPVTQHNTRGMVTFATAGPNTRANQFFINYGDNQRLDGMGFAPFGRVRDMAAVDRLHSGYGEGAPRGRGPSQGDMSRMGNTYLRSSFPELDYIQSGRIVEENGQAVQ
ncbi:MAG: peptidylprolyl isomerase [Deltaproteobacteria bacterium]|nr:peptidylprolyl isomerase [Deltaproteobacteria bacterium]